MEFLNFSDNEKAKIEKGLQFVTRAECNLSRLPASIPIIKTENYLQECQQFLDPERTIGTENPFATIVFPNNKTSTHKILINKDKIKGISYIHSVVSELIHLYNFYQYFDENGHLYTFNQEKMVENYYHEFLLWSKFQAQKVSTRAYTLMMWHETNGEEQPPDGKYQFEGISISPNGIANCLQELESCSDVPTLHDLFWILLGEVATYYGNLSFYQQEPMPQEIDPDFNEQLIDKWISLEKGLAFYGNLLSTGEYNAWKTNRGELRKVILSMEKHCSGTFKNSV